MAKKSKGVPTKTRKAETVGTLREENNRRRANQNAKKPNGRYQVAQIYGEHNFEVTVISKFTGIR